MGKEGGTARRGRGAGGRSPGCKLTPAPRGTGRTAARARTLAFTLASCSPAPSGDCTSPPRAAALLLRLIQIPSTEPHEYPGRSFSCPPAKPESLARTHSNASNFLCKQPPELRAGSYSAPTALVDGTAPCGKAEDSQTRRSTGPPAVPQCRIPSALYPAGFLRQKTGEFYDTSKQTERPSVLFLVVSQRIPGLKLFLITS